MLSTAPDDMQTTLAPKKLSQWIVDAAGGPDSDSATIQRVLTNARSGDTILVRAGTYRETIELGTSQVTLRGIAPRGGRVVVEGFGAATVAMNGGKATIEDLTIRQAGGGSFRAVTTRGISNLTLRNCEVISTTETAIVSEGQRLRVENCRVTSSEAKAGIGFKGGSEGEVIDSEISDNATVGIAVEQGSRAVIEGCHLHGNGSYALIASGGATATVRDCTIFRNPKTALASTDSRSTVDFQSGHLYENGLAFEVDDGGRATLRRTTLRANDYAGHVFGASARVALEDCDVLAQKKGGIQVGSGGGATVTRCRLTSNKDWALLAAPESGSSAAAPFIELSDSDLAQNGVGLAVMQGGAAQMVGNRFRLNDLHTDIRAGSDVDQGQNTFQPPAGSPGEAKNANLPTVSTDNTSASEERWLESGPGTPVRKAVLESARACLKEKTGVEWKFSVQYLRVNSMHAVAVFTPQSTDGKRKLAPAAFLFDQAAGDWEAVAAVSSPDVASEEAGLLTYSLRQMAAGEGTSVPAELFPEAPTAPEELARIFVRSYLLAGDSDDLDWQLAHLNTAEGARVEYYDEGKLTAEAIRRSLGDYNDRWPRRRVLLDGELNLKAVGAGRWVMNFNLRFENTNQTNGSRGRAAVTMTARERGGLLFVEAVSSKPLERQKFTVSARAASAPRNGQAPAPRSQPGSDFGKVFGRALKRSIHIGDKTLEDFFPTR